MRQSERIKATTRILAGIMVAMAFMVMAGCDRGKATPTATASAATNPQKGKIGVESQGKLVWVDPKSLQPGPRLRDTLSDEQLKRIKAFHDVFAEVDNSTFEETVDGFKRDMDPDREIAIWERMAKAYKTYCVTRILSLDAKQEVFNVVLMRSMASEEDALAHLKLKLLTVDEARTIMRGY